MIIYKIWNKEKKFYESFGSSNKVTWLSFPSEVLKHTYNRIEDLNKTHEVHSFKPLLDKKFDLYKKEIKDE